VPGTVEDCYGLLRTDGQHRLGTAPPRPGRARAAGKVRDGLCDPADAPSRGRSSGSARRRGHRG
jgi:hypothetical protein